MILFNKQQPKDHWDMQQLISMRKVMHAETWQAPVTRNINTLDTVCEALADVWGGECALQVFNVNVPQRVFL